MQITLRLANSDQLQFDSQRIQIHLRIIPIDSRKIRTHVHLGRFSLQRFIICFSRRVCISRRTRAKVSERALSSCIMHEANSGSGTSNLPHLPPRGLASPPERGRPWISLPFPPAFSPTKYYFTCIFIALRLNTALTFFPPPPPTTLSPPVLPFSRAGGHDDDERGGGGGGKEGGRMQIHRVLSIKYSTQGDHVLSPPSIRLFIAISVT